MDLSPDLSSALVGLVQVIALAAGLLVLAFGIGRIVENLIYRWVP